MATQSPKPTAAKPSITDADLRRLQITLDHVSDGHDVLLLTPEDIELLKSALAALVEVRAATREALAKLHSGKR